MDARRQSNMICTENAAKPPFSTGGMQRENLTVLTDHTVPPSENSFSRTHAWIVTCSELPALFDVVNCQSASVRTPEPFLKERGGKALRLEWLHSKPAQQLASNFHYHLI
jgi:hypothetical protein